MSVLRLIPAKGEAIVVDADEALVGREANCNVMVSHPSVSRRHALLKRKQDVFFVVDQGSANGTFVDSRRIVDAALKEGSILRFGSASFRVEVRDDVPAESITEDELVVSATMVGAPRFAATVLEGEPVEERPPTQPPTSRPEPAPAPRPAAPSSAAPALPMPPLAPPPQQAPPAVAPAGRSASFWMMVAMGALALLLVGAALGLGVAFVARRLGWI